MLLSYVSLYDKKPLTNIFCNRYYKIKYLAIYVENVFVSHSQSIKMFHSDIGDAAQFVVGMQSCHQWTQTCNDIIINIIIIQKSIHRISKTKLSFSFL